MTTNIKNYAVGAVERVHYARLDAVTEDYPAGTTGTIAAGSDSGMSTHKAFATFTDTPANATAVPIPGDAGNLGTMFSRSVESSTGNITFNTFDATFKSVAEDLSVYSDGDYEKIGIDDSCTVLNPMCMVINLHATSLEAASLDEQAWEVREIFRTTSEKTDESLSGTAFEAQPQGYDLVYSNTTTDNDNVTILDANYNRGKLRGVRYWSENPIDKHVLIGNAIVTEIVLDETPAAEDGDKVRVWEDGVLQDYTTDYTVVAATKTITFVAAPAADVVVTVSYEYVLEC